MRLLLVIIFCCTAMNALAQDISEPQRKALNNLQHELSECAMFYNISEKGFKKNGSADALKSSQQSAHMKDTLFIMAYMIGRDIGMNEDAMSTRLKMSFNSMMDMMDDNFVNYSILLQKYAEPCASLYRNADARINEAMGR